MCAWKLMSSARERACSDRRRSLEGCSACESQVPRAGAPTLSALRPVLFRYRKEFISTVVICLPCLLFLLIHHQTTPQRPSTTATRIPAPKRTHTPIAALRISYRDYTLITRHSTPGFVPTIHLRPDIDTGDDNQRSHQQCTCSQTPQI